MLAAQQSNKINKEMGGMHPRENYNDLYVFVMVAQEGSFTKAAAKLDIAQSGVSRTVRDLEARLGVQLLNRTTRKLSHAGGRAAVPNGARELSNAG